MFRIILKKVTSQMGL